MLDLLKLSKSKVQTKCLASELLKDPLEPARAQKNQTVSAASLVGLAVATADLDSPHPAAERNLAFRRVFSWGKP